VFSNRYEKGSTLITTNLEFAQWSELFHDTRMTAAILDRLVHNSKIVVFQGNSYRLQMHKESEDL
jgi:DNA replication protein DnaC